MVCLFDSVKKGLITSLQWLEDPYLLHSYAKFLKAEAGKVSSISYQKSENKAGFSTN